MKTIQTLTITLFTLLFSLISFNASAEDDKRKLVEMPKMMQQHQPANMRDHLKAIDEILMNMGKGELDKAADIAEARLGMSSLSLHGASHMAKVIPKEMGAIGTSMHKAASRFALKSTRRRCATRLQSTARSDRCVCCLSCRL